MEVHHNKSTTAHGRLTTAIGACILVFWLLVLMTQLTTTEASVNGLTGVNVYSPNWGVFLQPIFLVLGQVPASQIQGVVVAWTIELVLLALTVGGYALIHSTVHQGGRLLGIVFEVASFAFVAYNFYTDSQYGSIGAHTEYGNLIFALITSVVAAYFGVIGWAMLTRGWSNL